MATICPLILRRRPLAVQSSARLLDVLRFLTNGAFIMNSNLDSDRAPYAEQSSTGWRLLGQGLKVRFRFAFAIVALGVLMAIWPWLLGAWETVLAKWSSSFTESSVSVDKEFFCPMDPGVISVWPAICPICNMDLIPRKRADADMSPEGAVPRMQITPYRVQLAGVRTAPVQQIDSAAESDEQLALKIPVTSVINRNSEHIVYVETMQGMYDGVPVALGPRDGDFYRVDSGLKLGQRVIAVGAFLVDAENRLHPELSALYHGANKESAADRQTPKAKRPTTSEKLEPPLSEEDQKLVELQRFCPVMKAPLGSMGTPKIVLVKGRKIAICCIGCETRLSKTPERFLNWLDAVLKAYDSPFEPIKP